MRLAQSAPQETDVDIKRLTHFIALAEESGLILRLGRWVLETACAQLAAWAADPQRAHLTIAVNVSARQFHQDDFVTQVLNLLHTTGADPTHIKLELTESLLLKNVDSVITTMRALRAYGLGFSLDDYTARSFGVYQNPKQYDEVIWRFAPHAAARAAEAPRILRKECLMKK